MQTCPDCGVRNEDGELFCGACGTYLEWEEQQAGGAGAGSDSSTTAELTEAEPAPEPVVEQVDERVGEPATKARDAPAGSAAVESGPLTSASEPTRGKAAVDGPEETPAAPTAETPDGAAPDDPPLPPARRLLKQPAATKPAAAATKPAAVKPVQPAAVEPAAARPAVPAPVQPAAAKPRRHVPPTAKDEPPPAPGDLICGACGAGNAPHRNFCRRCGASLADAPTQGRTGWWGRWRARRRARKNGPKAGTRPKQRRRRRFPTKTVVVLVVLALLAGGGYYFRDELATGYHTVLDRVAGNNPVNPTEVTASSSAADRGPELARDGISNRSWAPEVTGDGAGEWLQFEFGEPFRLVTVLLTAGASTEDETRLLEARPSRVRLTVTTAGGEEQISDVDIVDSGEPQAIPLPVSDVVSVRMTILSAYGAADDVHVAVAEVEFRGR